MTSERSDRPFLIRFPGGSHNSESNPASGPMDVGNGHAHSHVASDKGSPGKPSLQHRHFIPGSMRGESPQRAAPHRRRVHSANSADVEARGTGESSTSARAQFMTEPAKPRRVSYRRNQQQSLGRANQGNMAHAGSSPLANYATLPSDDADEDPNILADLQRALQYKSRVEEQLRAGLTGTQPEMSLNSPPFPSSPTPSSTQNPFLAKIPFVHSDSGLTERVSPKDLDFSPSTGKVPMHPVPSSVDDGSTLDWSGTMSEDDRRERKWSIGIHRKVSKDKSSPLTRKGFVDKQEAVYEAKLDRIRSRMSDQTQRKARITREQLEHRYAILNHSTTFNLAAVPRWFDKLDEERKRTMDAPEQFPWIMHLLNKRAEPSHYQSPWTLSARIVDEYARSTLGMGIARQASTYNFTEGVTNVQDIHSHAHELGHALSRPTSFTSTEAAYLSRQKSDDLISFEPITVLQSRRGSAGTDSRNSTDARVRHWQTSLNGIGPYQDSPDSASVTLAKDSPTTSLQASAEAPQEKSLTQTSIGNRRRYSSSGEQGRSLSPRTPENNTRARSPLSSLSGISGVAKKKKRPTPASTQSDSSVVENDQLDSGSDIAGKSRGTVPLLSRIGEDTVPDLSKLGEAKGQKRSRFRLSLDLKSSQSRASLEDVRNINNKLLPPISIADLRTDVQLGPDGKPILKSLSLPPPRKNSSSLFPAGGMTTGTVSNPSRISLEHHPHSPNVERRIREKTRRKARMSLPGSLHASNVQNEREVQSLEDKLHALDSEHESREKLRDNLKARNSRMRQLLQTAAKTIADYDGIQCLMAEKLGMNYQPIPPEVIEAICHDPASATGNIRRATGWKAVEDIHERCEKQKSVLDGFTGTLSSGLSPATLPDGGIYHAHIEALTSELATLSKERLTIGVQTKRLVELLREVKELRDQLKPELDETGKHTSINYPELVRLESLLDELISRRNLLWRLVEFFVSFLLTLFAPFMKTFGRPIWDDLHDFLVIPIYRNDFSGGDKWYPVSFPRRSFPHWLRLLVAFVALPAALKTGSDVFFELLTGGYLIRVPSFIPTSVVYAILSVCITCFASTLIFLLFAFGCELAIIFWWTGWALCIVK